MQISTDPDGRVYVRWHPGGPFTVLDSGATVTTESGLGGAQLWAEHEEIDEDEGTYDDGYEAGLEDAADAVRDLATPRALRARKAPVPAPAPRKATV